MQWIQAKDRLPTGLGDKVKVRRENGDVIKAYYHKDQMRWLDFYDGKAPKSHFQCCKSLNFLFDVTHWLDMEKD